MGKSVFRFRFKLKFNKCVSSKFPGENVEEQVSQVVYGSNLAQKGWVSDSCFTCC